MSPTLIMLSAASAVLGIAITWLIAELWLASQGGATPKKEIGPGPGPPALDLDDFEKHLRRHRAR